ncbi:MAG: NADH pyrophosphatase [Microbacterium sp. 71-36]|uniref:NAD(+) diphosphatase n=1 Tax=unclassified Microbacterium TaxID=2609290 RepID=UPI00086DF952|nr:MULTISPECIES: NAD(+) diphosphatase [unclassified Microbacterium]MBN9211531.1 NAD(+) diphosphatase [Microbacterium sp.]ODT40846.1 MAG: NADH pyrophosphatase [Microbacterium sp. SCN 71-17]OJV77332.1 MAG: NADH pyrophosphatase [Microbacterium sp. 71-36]
MLLPVPAVPGPWPGGALDRAGAERDADDLIGTIRAASDTRVLAVLGDAAPVADERLLLLGVADLPSVREWAFLGRSADGAALLLAVVEEEPAAAAAAGARWAPLRSVGGDLPADEAEILGTAVALSGWLRDAGFCPACGTRTILRQAGWSRHCPHCGREHFPRTDPAVIVLVSSADDPDRVLLGANAAWGGSRYSCFAGFAEAGESLETTVSREVWEESGVRLEAIRYRGSQVWPYPRSLMLGFRARAVRDDEARPDGEEIVEVRWFDRAEIGAALRGETAVQLPGAASIAHRLIDEWYRGIE